MLEGYRPGRCCACGEDKPVYEAVEGYDMCAACARRNTDQVTKSWEAAGDQVLAMMQEADRLRGESQRLLIRVQQLEAEVDDRRECPTLAELETLPTVRKITCYCKVTHEIPLRQCGWKCVKCGYASKFRAYSSIGTEVEDWLDAAAKWLGYDELKKEVEELRAKLGGK